VPATLVLPTALATGAAAVALTPWMQRLAGAESLWMRSGLHAVVAACAGAGVAVLADGWAELVGFAVLAVGCALLVMIDLAVKRLPDAIVGPLYLALFAALAVAASLDGNPAGLARAAAAAGLAVTGYFVLAFISPAGLGLGDVKLAGVLAGFLGWLGWSEVMFGMLAAFALNAAVALVLLATGRATRHTEIPFGPLMVAGAALGAACGTQVWAW
jgi:leader peptidase (prepilin peptidase)/N-methyltransferase